MAMNSFAGTFTTTTSTSNIVVSGVGFVPEAIIFYWSGRVGAADAIGREAHFHGFGFAASPTDRRACCVTSVDAAATSDGGRLQHSAACVLSCTAAGVIDGALDLVSFDADGFTLAVDDAFPRDQRIGFLALGGDVTNAATGIFTIAGVTGNQDITSLAFQPDCVLFMSVGRNTDADTGNAEPTISFGAAVSSSQRGVWAGAQDQASATMDARSYCLGSECIALQPGGVGAAIAERADFVSFLSNGFRINVLETAAGSKRFHYLALQGGNYAIGNLLSQTDTTTDIVESGLGFAPSGALFVSAGKAESTADTPTSHNRLSIGAASSTSQRNAQGILDEDATADSEVTTALEFDEVYVNIGTGSTVDGLMDVKSFDSDGLTCIMDAADPSQSFVWYLATGPAPVAATLSLPPAAQMRLPQAILAR
jgi:hypothetical protein